MLSVLCMPQAARLTPERRSWLATKAGEYIQYLVNTQGEDPETARRRAWTRALNNVDTK